MAYITDLQLESRLDTPIQLPLTSLQAGDWLVVSSFQIPQAPPTLTATMWWEQIQLYPISAPGQINEKVHLGIFLNFNNSLSPLQQTPIEEIFVTNLQPFAQRPLTATALSLTQVGIYSVVAYVEYAAISQAVILDQGINYAAGPAVTFVGGGSSVNQASATTTIANGGVSGITIVSPGGMYTSSPSVTLTGGQSCTGTSAGATAQAYAVASCNFSVTGAIRLDLLEGMGFIQGTTGPQGQPGPAGLQGPPGNTVVGPKGAPGSTSIMALFESLLVQTYVLDVSSAYGYTLINMATETSSGSATVTVLNNGVAVPGLTNITVTPTPTTFVATGSAQVSAGSSLALQVTSNSSAVDFNLSIKLG